jgi:hypothetical protein
MVTSFDFPVNTVKEDIMDRVRKVLKLSNKRFKRLIGTTKPVFHMMLAVLEVAYEKLHEFGGNPKGLTVTEKLLITLQYWREYRPMEHISLDFGCSKSTVSRSIAWVEDTLSVDGRFQLLGKQALTEGKMKTVAVDVTEHPIERPKKSRRSGIPARKSDIPSNRKS